MADGETGDEREADAGMAKLRLAVVTVSDSRTEATDGGGDLVASLVTQAGFLVASRHLLTDDEDGIRARLRELIDGGSVDCVLLTGGTGIAPRDRTIEAVLPLLERRLDGYGELFRMLSFAEIGPAAMLSRAVAGVVREVALFTMPGSPGGARLALERLILPELSHVVAELKRGGRRRHGPHGHHGHGDTRGGYS